MLFMPVRQQVILHQGNQGATETCLASSPHLVMSLGAQHLQGALTPQLGVLVSTPMGSTSNFLMLHFA